MKNEKWRICFLILFLFGCSRSPNQIFIAIFNKITDDTVVLHAQDQHPLDCCIWLHFKTSQEGFNELFDMFSEESLDYNHWSGVLPPEVDWWNPEKFAQEGVSFEW